MIYVYLLASHFVNLRWWAVPTRPKLNSQFSILNSQLITYLPIHADALVKSSYLE
jgi:hypothetical protein